MENLSQKLSSKQSPLNCYLYLCHFEIVNILMLNLVTSVNSRPDSDTLSPPQTPNPPLILHNHDVPKVGLFHIVSNIDNIL